MNATTICTNSSTVCKKYCTQSQDNSTYKDVFGLHHFHGAMSTRNKVGIHSKSTAPSSITSNHTAPDAVAVERERVMKRESERMREGTLQIEIRVERLNSTSESTSKSL